jgi:D-inositol-3-phosphate glycosyltransferase
MDDAFRARLSRGARDRGAMFSWEGTAERTLDVYERARHALRELV